MQVWRQFPAVAKIHKHLLQGYGLINRIPGGKVLLFGIQENSFFIWIEERSGHEIEEYIILLTGTEVNGLKQHIQSIQDGADVWHLYQIL